jgi:methyl-accepting chemotaxis protein
LLLLSVNLRIQMIFHKLVERTRDIVIQWECSDLEDGILIVLSSNKFPSYDEVMTNLVHPQTYPHSHIMISKDRYKKSQHDTIQRSKNNQYIMLIPYINAQGKIYIQSPDQWIQHSLASNRTPKIIHYQIEVVSDQLKLLLQIKPRTLTNIPPSSLVIESTTSQIGKISLPSYDLSIMNRMTGKLTINLNQRQLKYLKILLPAKITWQIAAYDFEILTNDVFYLNDIQLKQPNLPYEPAQFERDILTGKLRFDDVVGRVNNWQTLPWAIHNLLDDFMVVSSVHQANIIEIINTLIESDNQIIKEIYQSHLYNEETFLLFLEMLITYNIQHLSLLEQLILDTNHLLSAEIFYACMQMQLNYQDNALFDITIKNWMQIPHTRDVVIQILATSYPDRINLLKVLLSQQSSDQSASTFELFTQHLKLEADNSVMVIDVLLEVLEDNGATDLHPIINKYIFEQIKAHPSSEAVYNIFEKLIEHNKHTALFYEAMVRWYERTGFNVYSSLDDKNNDLIKTAKLLYHKGNNRLLTTFDRRPLLDTPENMLSLAGKIGNPILWRNIIPYLDERYPEIVNLHAIWATGMIRTTPENIVQTNIPSNTSLIKELVIFLDEKYATTISKATLDALKLIGTEEQDDLTVLTSALERYINIYGLTNQVVDVVIQHQLIDFVAKISRTSQWITHYQDAYLRLWQAIPILDATNIVGDYVLMNPTVDIKSYLPKSSEYAPITQWYFAQRDLVRVNSHVSALENEWLKIRKQLIDTQILANPSQKPQVRTLQDLSTRHIAVQQEINPLEHQIKLKMSQQYQQKSLQNIYEEMLVQINGNLNRLKAIKKGTIDVSSAIDKSNKQLDDLLRRLNQLPNESNGVNDARQIIQSLHTLNTNPTTHDIDAQIRNLEEAVKSTKGTILYSQKSLQNIHVEINQLTQQLDALRNLSTSIEGHIQPIQQMLNDYQQYRHQIETIKQAMTTYQEALLDASEQIQQMLEFQVNQKRHEYIQKIHSYRTKLNLETKKPISKQQWGI